ncbi:MAG: M23 family metallopeptidase [Pseudomonadota bacterium]
MRTLGIIVATAIVTALATSVAWVMLYERADREVEPAVEVPSSPAPVTPPEVEMQPDDMVFAADGDDLEGLIARRLTVPIAGYDISGLAETAERLPTTDGLPFAAVEGTPVVAVDDGVLIKFYDSEAGGTAIYQFDPTETWVYVYERLGSRAAAVEEGESVRRGQVIGTVGATENEGQAAGFRFRVERLKPGGNWWNSEPVPAYPAFAFR